MRRIRKLVLQQEEIVAEHGRLVEPSIRRAIAAAVLTNCAAPVSDDEWEELAWLGGELGSLLTQRCLEALGGKVEAYGKGALIGAACPVERGAAIIHPRLGKSMRALIEGATAIVPSAKKRAGLGASLDVPMQSIADPWSFDHLDALPLIIQDAPGADEIVVAIAISTGARPCARTKRE